MSKLWRYKLDRMHIVHAPELSGISFTSEWLTITDSIVIIHAEYAWDGCSRTWRIHLHPILPNGLWLGPWDGALTTKARPFTWEASLVHDALCQYREDIHGLTKAATIAIFKRLLAEYGAPSWVVALYPAAVSRFGPQHWLGDTCPKHTTLA